MSCLNVWFLIHNKIHLKPREQLYHLKNRPRSNFWTTKPNHFHAIYSYKISYISNAAILITWWSGYSLSLPSWKAHWWTKMADNSIWYGIKFTFRGLLMLTNNKKNATQKDSYWFKQRNYWECSNCSWDRQCSYQLFKSFKCGRCFR